MTASRKAENRAIRTEELRRYLEERGKVSYVLDLIEKLEDESVQLEKPMVDRMKVAMDARLRLLNKYLPGVQAIEVTGDSGGPVEHDHYVDLETALQVLNEHGVDVSKL